MLDLVLCDENIRKEGGTHLSMIHPPTHPLTHLSIHHPSTNPSILHSSIYPSSSHLSKNPSTHPPVHSSIHPSIHPSLRIIYLSIRLCLCQCMYPSSIIHHPSSIHPQVPAILLPGTMHFNGHCAPAFLAKTLRKKMFCFNFLIQLFIYLYLEIKLIIEFPGITSRTGILIAF